jgi:hypothetical protein
LAGYETTQYYRTKGPQFPIQRRYLALQGGEHHFVPVGGAGVKVDPSDIVVNNLSKVITIIPPLSAGTYRVRIITRYTSGKQLKTPNTLTFDKDLTIA